MKFTQWRKVTYAGMAEDTSLQERTYSYFGADEKLRVMDGRTCAMGVVYTSGQSWWAAPNQGYICGSPDYSDRPT